MSYHTIVGIRGRPPPTLLPWQHLIGNKTLSGHPTMEREVAKAPNSCPLTQVREAMEKEAREAMEKEEVAREAMAKEEMAREAKGARALVATTVEHQIMGGGNALNPTMQQALPTQEELIGQVLSLTHHLNRPHPPYLPLLKPTKPHQLCSPLLNNLHHPCSGTHKKHGIKTTGDLMVTMTTPWHQ